jgi:hypothetical protein
MIYFDYKLLNPEELYPMERSIYFRIGIIHKSFFKEGS